MIIKSIIKNRDSVYIIRTDETEESARRLGLPAEAGCIRGKDSEVVKRFIATADNIKEAESMYKKAGE